MQGLSKVKGRRSQQGGEVVTSEEMSRMGNIGTFFSTWASPHTELNTSLNTKVPVVHSEIQKEPM